MTASCTDRCNKSQATLVADGGARGCLARLCADVYMYSLLGHGLGTRGLVRAGAFAFGLFGDVHHTA